MVVFSFEGSDFKEYWPNDCNFSKKEEMKASLQDSNNFSIGNHFFKVLVQIHYSHPPGPVFHLEGVISPNLHLISVKFSDQEAYLSDFQIHSYLIKA